MRTLTVLSTIALLCLSVACSSSETVDEDAPPAEVPDELDEEESAESPAEPDEETDEELDLSELIDQQIAACNELVCERPFECLEDADDDDFDPGFTTDECYDLYCGINRKAMEAMEHTEGLKHCLEVDAELGECLDGLSCDAFMTYVDPDVDDAGSCDAEIAAQEEACAPYWAQAEELRIERMRKDQMNE